MAKASGGGGRGGVVGRARRGGVIDIGQFSKSEKRELQSAVRAGKLIKTTSYAFPIPKTVYVRPPKR